MRKIGIISMNTELTFQKKKKTILHSQHAGLILWG